MLNCKSLKYQQLKFDMVFLYKIYYNMIDIDFNDYFIKNYNNYDLHKYTHHIRPKFRPRTDCYNNFLIYRACKI